MSQLEQLSFGKEQEGNKLWKLLGSFFIPQLTLGFHWSLDTWWERTQSSIYKKEFCI